MRRVYLKILKLPPISLWLLYLLSAAYLLVTANAKYFDALTTLYPWRDYSAFLVSATVASGAAVLLTLVFFSLFIPTRLALSLMLLIAVFSAYFADTSGVVVDPDMVRNIVETDTAEAGDLLSLGLIMRLATLGLLPVWLLWVYPLKRIDWRRALLIKLGLSLCAVLAIVLVAAPFTAEYASFIREHKSVRYYAIPTYPVSSVVRYISQQFDAGSVPSFNRLNSEARITDPDEHAELIVLVVGETARADHFSLNGYDRETNPELAKESRLISYSQIRSCGTSTAISVPCMFAYAGHDDFDVRQARYTENALDLLSTAGVNILWRDNNSDSKDVALRVDYQNFRDPQHNPVCDEECRDVGMLDGLQAYIDQHPGDILIVLHQMGSHGPAYYRRYPAAFEYFSPSCQSNELASCSEQEIINAYDNSIRYTDYFLSRVIALLKDNTPKYETAMFYISDHGESLGESGLYLHGLPHSFAPDTQKDVPVLVWVSESSDVDLEQSRAYKDIPNSHDALFDALLTLFEVKSRLTPAGTLPLIQITEKE